LSYRATIRTATGIFGDDGDSGILISQLNATVVGGTGTITNSDVLNEAFRSSLTTVFPVVTSGHVNGGGQTSEDVTFGLEAKSDDAGIKAECTVVDRASNTKVKCLDATFFAQTANHVTFSGHAVVNGLATMYVIDVDDVAEPGRGADDFQISTAIGYSAGGTLMQGNIQVHGE
jgi:hypothetical protein